MVISTGSCCTSRMFPLTGSAVWKPVDARGAAIGVRRLGAQVVGPAGPQAVVWAPEIEYELSTYTSPFGFEMPTPFSPATYASPASGGKLVFGASDRYRFEVLAPDGARLIVQRYWEPVPVPAEHEDWERRLIVAANRESALARGADPSGSELRNSQIPDHKPAYRWFVPAQSGEIWVQRLGPSEELAECAGDPFEVGYAEAQQSPCWRDVLLMDAFGSDGRFLGPISMPHDQIRGTTLTIRGRVVVGAVRDDDGNYLVKRYRLVLPGDE